MSYKNYDGKCNECDEQYTNDLNAEYEWCKICQAKYLENFTSGNEKIDILIQEIQSKINDPNDILFGWIPYNQFDDVKEVGKNDFTTVYSAIWKDGPSHYSYFKKELTRVSNKKVALKCLYGNSQNIINEFLNEVKTYSINYLNDVLKIYGISQNPDTKDYIMVLHDEYFEKCCNKCGKLYTNTEYKWCNSCHVNYLKKNFTKRISENEEIDNYIHEMQLKINNPCTIVFEWIQYDNFGKINEIGKSGFATFYLAIWKNGPLHYEYMTGWAREPNKKVTLKSFENLQDSTNEFLNEVKTYSIDYYDNNFKIYGISQNPNTKDYIMVLQNEYCEKCVKCGIKYVDTLYKWCNLCQINDLKNNFTNWTSKDEKIDNFIQEMQLKINNLSNIVFEWIPYNQFNDVKEISRNDFFTIYSAIWKDGPLSYNYVKKELTRVSDKKVALKPYYNSKNITNEFVDEVKKYSINYLNNILKIYGMSQNPDTKDYIMVFPSEHCEKCDRQYIDDLSAKYEWCKRCQINCLKEDFTKWTSGNKTIDILIQKTQLKIDNPNGIVFEWIPYNQFNEIKEIGEGGFYTVYSAIWKDGPLYYLYDKKEWIRKPKKVALRCLNNSQNVTYDFLNEVKANLILDTRFIINIYGISQELNTGNYIMIFDYAEGGSINNWLYINDNYKEFSWSLKLKALLDVIQGLKEIHQIQMVHCNLHTGNLLISTNNVRDFNVYIDDMKLCKRIDDIDNIKETDIYGVMPYMAPEVLRGKPYTQAADIYSFGMIMYFAATGKQPFIDYEHDHHLMLEVCNGIRPKINVTEAPECYIDLMKRCWDSNPNYRPTAIDIEELITIFKLEESEEIKKQFKEAEEYRKANLKVNASPKYDKYDDDNDDNISNASTDIIVDFTKLHDQKLDYNFDEKGYDSYDSYDSNDSMKSTHISDNNFFLQTEY